MATASEVREMFSAIAPQYDRLNGVLSCGVDRIWRRLVVRSLGPLVGRDVLDLCCGTGDLALGLAAVGARVTGTDFSQPMLPLARQKAATRNLGVQWIRGDALHLPIATDSFDVVTMAFGLRNVVRPAEAIQECARVLRPGGKLGILEFFDVQNPLLGPLFRVYFHHVLPRIARCFQPGSSVAYDYLPQSVAEFAPPQEVLGWMQQAGFGELSNRSLTGGISRFLTGLVPDPIP